MSTPIVTPDGLWLLSSAVFTKIPPPPPPPPPVSLEPLIPANAVVIDMLPSVKWVGNHDLGTPGTSSGVTVYPATAPDGSTARRFDVTASGKGGEIFHANVISDSSMYNTFCLETVESSIHWPLIACAEKDMEHANPTGHYVDMAEQLSSYSGTIEITGGGKWISTNVKSNPTTLALNVLHTQRRHFRDNGDGTVNYPGIFMDGVFSQFSNTVAVKSAPSAIWGKNVLNLQIQYDSISTPQVSFTVWMHVMRVHCWKT